MKRYQSHKVVEAAPMTACEFREDGSGQVWIADPAGGNLMVEVSAGFRRPGATVRPCEGDYLVRYQPDGYLSWSPRAAFEAGYTAVEDKPATWQERAVHELNELGVRVEGIRSALIKGTVTDPQPVALMQQQYRAMEAYHASLELRLRHAGVIDVETPPTVRETPATVEVTVTAPAGKRAEVIHGRAEQQTAFTVTEGQTQSWSVMNGERVTVWSRDTSTVAHKRETD